MSRSFNTAGPCLPDDHYLLAPERRLREVRALIEAKAYFVIHAPRQTGKTTLLRTLSRALTAEGRHAAITVSLESFTEPDVTAMLPQLLVAITEAANQQLPEALRPPDPAPFATEPYLALKRHLSAWAAALPDLWWSSSMRSTPCPARCSSRCSASSATATAPWPAPFPTSVALVGVRDVRDYRIQLRPHTESLGTSSPFNIKTDSLTLRSFDTTEVTELLGQHQADTGQAFAPEASAEIFHQTQGQPWLVNALAAQLVTRHDALVPDRAQAVTRADVLVARDRLIERRDTHLDSLVDRLRDDRVRRVIEPILVGATMLADVFHDDLQYAEDLGLVARRGGVTVIANPIYQEIIPRVLTYVTQGSIALTPDWFVAADGTLRVRALLEGFRDFWREHGEVLLRGMAYQEAAPHLTFMAYLQRVVNAGGRIDRELAIGTGRADLVVEKGGRRDVIELKIQRSSRTLQQGLTQVAAYAKRIGRDEGYLIIFDRGSVVPWEDRGVIEERVEEGVRVVVLRA